MSAGQYNIEVEQGATWRQKFTVDNDGEPFDFTDCVVRLQVRAKVTSADVLVEKTTEDSTITVGAGFFVVEFSDEESAAWAWRKGVYDVEIELPGGDVIRLLEGPVKVKPEVTR